MRIVNDTQIVRSAQVGETQEWCRHGKMAPVTMEWEIPVAYNVEELYKGTEEPDDPSECTINERVKVLEDAGPFRVGDMLVLTADEQREIEEDELNNQL
jgi:hypothetical protein